MQDIIRGNSDIIKERAHDKNSNNDNNNLDNISNMNDSNINDIQSLLAKNQKRKSMASKHLVRSNSRSNSNSNSREATKKQRRCMAYHNTSQQ